MRRNDTNVTAALPAYRDAGLVNVIVETPKGSIAKFKYDAVSGLMMLSRPLPSGVAYPYDWGYIPGTRAADGDPLDAIVIWEGASFPGILIPCRLVSVLRVEQTNLESGKRERNDRVLAVPAKAPRLQSLRGLSDVTERQRAELEHFFQAAVAFEGKNVSMLGWGDVDDAAATVNASLV
jgi:inorganic pyrophosphatase